jgi:hypothetical protein
MTVSRQAAQSQHTNTQSSSGSVQSPLHAAPRQSRLLLKLSLLIKICLIEPRVPSPMSSLPDIMVEDLLGTKFGAEHIRELGKQTLIVAACRIPSCFRYWTGLGTRNCHEQLTSRDPYASVSSVLDSITYYTACQLCKSTLISPIASRSTLKCSQALFIYTCFGGATVTASFLAPLRSPIRLCCQLKIAWFCFIESLSMT